MLLQPDLRLKAAFRDDNAARALLGELHQQILNIRDPNIVSGLLAKYVALATVRTTSPPPGLSLPSALVFQQETRLFQTISNILKSVHDTSSSIIQNMK